MKSAGSDSPEGDSMVPPEGAISDPPPNDDCHCWLKSSPLTEAMLRMSLSSDMSSFSRSYSADSRSPADAPVHHQRYWHMHQSIQ